jgi:hypothetical protein
MYFLRLLSRDAPWETTAFDLIENSEILRMIACLRCCDCLTLSHYIFKLIAL